MKVSDLMTRDVQVIAPDETLEQAARAMALLDAGILPVGDAGRLVGMISDRDIAVRGVALGKGPATRVREIMSGEVKYCFEDQEIDEIGRNMAEQQVRRLPVVNRTKQLVGILSLGDIAVAGREAIAGDALGGISRPGGAHTQAM
ncbi:CBS domain-containing protein [Ancylobacter sonchi]|uniref:CBS domain-containing protein n=1 Tax=Ancylobacter sonchi TaxID=1937790 RepID=UPI001BD3FC42|nr:CBS domain-containing protein [Ancylobacter sonchi]MBS7534212.1 CBS domain-containing protein [Ancylobacter sonchi]